MSDILDTFDNLINSLSLAQVSIEKTSRFVLKNLGHIDKILERWKHYLESADDKKLTCLLYLANEVIQKVRHEDQSCRKKFLECLYENICYFKTDSLAQTFYKVLKIWKDRTVITQEYYQQFVKALELESSPYEESKKGEEYYGISRLMGYLNIFDEMNNMIVAYKSSSTKEAISKFEKELHKLRSTKNNSERIKKFLNQILIERKKVVSQLQEVKEAILNCRIQTSHITDYKTFFEKQYLKAETTCEEYSEYRNRIIQLRWRIEKVNEKFNEQLATEDCSTEHGIYDNNMVTDMDVEETKDNTKKNYTNPSSFNLEPNFIEPFPQNQQKCDVFQPQFPNYSPYQIHPCQSLESSVFPQSNIVDYNHGIINNENPPAFNPYINPANFTSEMPPEFMTSYPPPHFPPLSFPDFNNPNDFPPSNYKIRPTYGHRPPSNFPY